MAPYMRPIESVLPVGPDRTASWPAAFAIAFICLTLICRCGFAEAIRYIICAMPFAATPVALETRSAAFSKAGSWVRLMPASIASWLICC